MGFGESVESVSRQFGHPIALSTSEDVELRAFSTQGHDGVLDVVEASYVVRGDEEGRVQPSVWTWLANGISQEEAAVNHGVTHHISHLAEFRAGTRVPDSDETDRLHQTLVESPRTSTVLEIEGASTMGAVFTLDAWTYSSSDLGATFVTVAGPGWFVTCPLRLRAV
ncbi:hypothetical protein [Herbiconiux ginsengi]|uniref:Uncharacterized protein n=1 Tax=Herbiconiux ginsengi TaxID=381665 RepID=A0A1H3S4W1_9MICO|nr:hypothetical protein [Herbiconiux ginsengi]SDZ32605.1 hypothetical protein SAMN05216554_3285 [Herbiconiux ginsengi]